MTNQQTLSIPGVAFHHLGLLTEKPEKAAIVLQSFGYTISEPVHDNLQQVKLQMASLDNEHAHIEIITPFITNHKLIELVQRQNDYMYHSCFTVENMNVLIEEFSNRNIRAFQISPPKPAILFSNKHVSFYAIEGLGLVEFIDQNYEANN
ncbi:MAG: VOC family protein [Fibrobacterales bacterium]